MKLDIEEVKKLMYATHIFRRTHQLFHKQQKKASFQVKIN